MSLVSEEGFREDGRKQKEFRWMRISQRRIGCKGFLELRHGRTQVMVTCNGFCEPGKLDIKVRFNNTSMQEPINEKRVLKYETILFDIFDSVVLSESLVNVEITVKEDGGSLLSAMINGVSLCLCYFGVPMIDTCCSMTLTEDCVDLSSNEDEKRIPVITVACLTNRDSIIYLSSVGRIQQSKLKQCIKEGVELCRTIVYERFKRFLLSQTDCIDFLAT